MGEDNQADAALPGGGHHRHHNGATATTRRRRFRPRFSPFARRSLTVRILTTITLSLPPILFLISFSLTAAVINSVPDFVLSDRLTTGDLGSNTTGLPTGTVMKASPFFDCTPLDPPVNETDPNWYAETCAPRTPSAWGPAGTNACLDALSGGTVSKLCVSIVAAAELYLAGAVLGGVAFLAASFYGLIVVAKMGAGPRYTYHYHVARREEPRSTEDEDDEDPPLPSRAANGALGAFAALLGLAAAVCLVLGQVLAYAALVLEVSDLESLLATADHSRWYMGRGIRDFTGAAYGLALIGVFIMITRCGLHE